MPDTLLEPSLVLLERRMVRGVLNYSELRYIRECGYTHAFRPLLRPLLIGINRYQIYRETHNSTRPRWHVERKLAATRVHTHTNENLATKVGARARVGEGLSISVILCTSPRWIWIRGQRATGSSIYAANSVKRYLPNRRGIGEKCAREARRIASHASPPSQIRRVFSSLVTEIESRAKNLRIWSLCSTVKYQPTYINLYKWVPFEFFMHGEMDRYKINWILFLNNRYLSSFNKSMQYYIDLRLLF